ncbi:helix-turn-helix domain-containing protein [Mycobacterium noviomagense]|uniref:Forkhead-associated protein n=1 Tax=Mycobacterium noviomagense TaxID=459858 RepID=A0A7I7PJY1_9MYCO|nr:forkhead-associated protein [Mycobacterium noviomagense]ORB16329.1 forkhead-associated protein [Mycobacterium noviomagense]BBY08866.1 forkhead-associated protein [Mycobacterium noviomagense]
MGEFDPINGEAQVIVDVAEAAMHMYRAAIDSLFFPEDKKFQKRADIVLSGLRKLRAALTDAASHSRSTSAVIVALSEVRRRYDDLMARAAAAPGSSLGQQLYAARLRANLSASEVANGAGLRADLPDALEAGATPTDSEAEKIRELIATLRAITGPDDFEQPQPSEAQVNGWDESLAINGADQEAEAAAT